MESITRNLPIKLISILIAVVLWVVVLGSGTAEESKEISLELVTSPDLIVVNDIPERVVFRLSGPKAALRTAVKRRYDPIRINLVGSKPGIVTHRFFSDQIRLPIGVRVTSVTPNSLMIKTEAVATKQVPIKVLTRGQLPDGMTVASLQALPDTVKITGAESRVATVTEVSTVPIDLSVVTGSQESDVALDLLAVGLRSDASAAHVRIAVEGHGANFKIKNVPIRVVGMVRARVEPRTVTALVRAAPADLRKLDQSKVFAEIRAQGRAKGHFEEAVKIVLPESVTLVRVIPERVKLTVY
ncbi:MAG: YbbR-like domain-containing protein [Oligoflexia bacterium]